MRLKLVALSAAFVFAAGVASAQDKTVELRLSTVEIAGNLQLTASSVWAWYLLGPERWSFKSLADREEPVARSFWIIDGEVTEEELSIT